VGQLLTQKHIHLAFFFLFVCRIPALAASDNPPKATFRSQVSEVRLVFSATDQNNHAIATLKPTDIAVVDTDFIVRNFRSFTLADFSKLEIVVLIDASGSTIPRHREEIAQLIDFISRTAGIPEQSFSIASFSGLRPTLICQGDCRSSRVIEMLAATKPGGLTPLYDSLEFAAQLFSSSTDPQARRVLILFSDGEDTISKTTADAALGKLIAKDVQAYTVDLGGSPWQGRAFLSDLAASTGGRRSGIKDGADAIANAILDDFHASYLVTYQIPSRSAGFHSIHIFPTHNLHLNFRCRRGYQYPASSN